MKFLTYFHFFGILILIGCAPIKERSISDVSDDVAEDDNTSIVDIKPVYTKTESFEKRIKKYGISTYAKMKEAIGAQTTYSPYPIIPLNHQSLFKPKLNKFYIPLTKAEAALFNMKWELFNKKNLNPTEENVINQAKIIYVNIPEIFNIVKSWEEAALEN